MSSSTSLSEQLPSVHLNRPESSWIHSASVTGPFGITASVRDFAEVIDWQEHTRDLTQGYYRLIHPPRLQRLKACLESRYPGWTAVLFTSGKMAEKETGDLIEVLGRPESLMLHDVLPGGLESGALHVVSVEEHDMPAGFTLMEDPDLAAVLHERNRRRGGSLSARGVAHLLGESDAEPFESSDRNACVDLMNRLEPAESILFYPSGMGAVTAVLDEVLTLETPRMVVLGNVYRDTHLLLEEQAWAGRDVEGIFLDTDDLDGLSRHLQDPKVAGVFMETITNPLIEIPNLPAIADLCSRAGKALLVDSTMASPFNVHPLELGATVVIHSTSKYLSGHNSHGGGVVLTNHSQWAEAFADSQAAWNNHLSPAEFTPLKQGLETFSKRMPRFNANGKVLADMLRKHPAVETVYFANEGGPEWLGGLGSVVSCELKTPSLEKVATFFDDPLPGVVKAPSLGSDQTLFCPYVLLAYYDKSEEYLKDCNLSKTLFRFAAGSEEDFDSVLASISSALDKTL